MRGHDTIASTILGFVEGVVRTRQEIGACFVRVKGCNIRETPHVVARPKDDTGPQEPDSGYHLGGDP